MRIFGLSLIARKRIIPKENAGKRQRIILILFVLSFLFFALVKLLPVKKGEILFKEMLSASRTMEESIAVLRECYKEKELILDKTSDLNQTGLIGLESSSITTSLGSLEAKRTTTNPNFAALLVFLLNKTGIRKGDTVAVGASGSFPALIIAVLSAAKAMDLKPLVICSLGASQWGANNPDFFWLDIQNCLLKAGIFDTRPIGFSLGGEKDTGEDMSSEGRSFLKEEIRESGILFIQEPDLERNVKARIRLYEEYAGKDRIKTFINIGGGWSNIGEDSKILELKPGLVRVRQFPQVGKRGVLYEMASRKIPVVHLLFIKGLVLRYGLEWDPVPLPQAGKGKIYQFAREKQPAFLILSAFYFLFVILALIFRNRLE
ncbi:MAG: poly-gamma-glutamate system protein [Candidatus Aminicenantes bacterium]|nr:poly-gamma-glutamate system protein [Candidatus Aminicenantes bacterium]